MSLPLSQPGVDYLLYNDTGKSFIDIGAPRVINVGLAETTMVGMACGLAHEGAKVYCVAHTPHYLRTWEIVRSLLVPRRYNVILLGVGADDDYASLGHAHQMWMGEMENYCLGAELDHTCVRFLDSLTHLMSKDGPRFIQIPKHVLKEVK
jgi:transketolase C-terminal domain/subunit